jgi:hypothetical protein
MVLHLKSHPFAQLQMRSGDLRSLAFLAVLARRGQPVLPPGITTPNTLRLKIEPLADCGRYHSIRKIA